MAVTLLGLVLGTALELMAVGLRSAKASGDYTRAVLLAKQKLQELSVQEIAPRSLSGAGEGYHWAAEVSPADGEGQRPPARLFTLRVKVWPSGRSEARGVELFTLRLAEGPPTALLPVPGGSQPSPAVGRPVGSRSGQGR